jgi:hypothetical protein
VQFACTEGEADAYQGRGRTKPGTACRPVHAESGKIGEIFYCSAESDGLLLDTQNMKGPSVRWDTIITQSRSQQEIRIQLGSCHLPENKNILLNSSRFFFWEIRTKQFQISSQVQATVYTYCKIVLVFIEIHAMCKKKLPLFSFQSLVTIQNDWSGWPSISTI